MDNSTKNVLIAAGAGLTVGAILGVLFAPAKGTETREQIADKFKDVKDKVMGNKSTEELLLQLKEALVSKASSNGKDASKDLLAQIEKLEESLHS